MHTSHAMNMKISSQGGLIVTLKELTDMHRVGFKYKLNHRTQDLIAFRNLINQEISNRMRGHEHEKKDVPKDQKRA